VWDQFRYTLATAGYTDRTSTKYDNSGRPRSGGEPAVEDLMAASIAAHGLVMASNGVAFIQGDEEIYRTKTISDVDNYAQGIKATTEYEELMEGGDEAYVRPFPDFENYDPTFTATALATGEVRMYGTSEMVSHNSYKLPDSVNSFKWDRKIHIGSTLTYDKISTWSTMVNKRKEVTKYGYGAPELDQFSLWNNDGQSDWYQGAFAMSNPGGINVAITCRGQTSYIKIGNVTPIYYSNFKSSDFNISEDGWLGAGSYTLLAWW
jgi:hypothetical protein